MDQTPQENEKNKRIWKLLLILCVMGAAVCLCIFGYHYYVKKQAEQRFQALAEQTLSTQETAQEETSGYKEEADTVPASSQEADPEEALQLLADQLGIELPERNLDLDALRREVNPDIYAWITIPGTEIDYPILQHPEDNTYYLNYNLDGTRGYPGCIYTENYNSKNFDDRNTVLYGHNMKDGSMFAGLHQFADTQYFEKHPYIFIYTDDSTLIYRVFAAYEFSNVHLLLGYDTASEDGFSEYLEEIKAACAQGGSMAEDIQVTEKDRLLTLSTCVGGRSERRYLVQGVLLNDRGILP